MKKRILGILFIMSLAFSITGCGILNLAKNLGKDTISLDELNSYISEPIAITTDNWQDYFDVYVLEESRDDTIPCAKVGLVLKDGYIIYPDDTYPSITLNDFVTVYLPNCLLFNKINNYYDLECTEAYGYVRECDIPEEKWVKSEDADRLEIVIDMGRDGEEIIYKEVGLDLSQGSYTLLSDLEKPADLPEYIEMPSNLQTFHYSPKFNDFSSFDILYDADLVSPASLDFWTYGWLAEDPQNEEDPCAQFYVMPGTCNEFFTSESDTFRNGSWYSNVIISETEATTINNYNGYYWTITYDVGGNTFVRYYYATQLDEGHYFYICVGDTYLNGRMEAKEFFKAFMYDIVVY